MNPLKTTQTKRAALVSVRFALTKPQSSESSLQCRIGVNSEYAPDFVVARGLKTSYWAQDLQKMLDGSPESEQLNALIAFIKGDLKRIELGFLINRQPIAAKALKAAYLQENGHTKAEPKVQPTRPTVQECYMAFYDYKSKEKRNPVCDRTREAYWKYQRIFNQYLDEIGINKIHADEITHEWTDKFYDWLLKRPYKINYSNKCVYHLKSILKYAENAEIISRNGTKTFKIVDSDDHDTTHLTMDEVQRIVEMDFTTLPIHADTAQSLRQEADCFIFSCFSGQHDADMRDRNVEVFIYDSRTWIRNVRVKTKKSYVLPLHPIALSILERYGSIDKLPLRASTKRNSLLKQIAAFCGIDKKLTTKIGRKTLTNYGLNVQRMRTDTVAAMLGHSSTKSLKHYGKITEVSINAEYQF